MDRVKHYYLAPHGVACDVKIYGRGQLKWAWPQIFSHTLCMQAV